MVVENENARSASTRGHAKSLLLLAGLVGLCALAVYHRVFRNDGPAAAPTSSPANVSPATP